MFRTPKRSIWENNGHNGFCNQNIKLKLIYIHLISFSCMQAKFKVLHGFLIVLKHFSLVELFWPTKNVWLGRRNFQLFEKFFRKNIVLIVWVNIFIWKCNIFKAHYLAVLCQIFKVIFWFLTDWELVFRVLIF